MTTYVNGRLPNSVLSPILGGMLRTDASLAWNAMCDEARRRGMPVPMPDGPDSTYRSYDRQVYWRNWWCNRGACGNAAVPGTSRHGLGIAVDCAEDATHHAATIDAIGEKYGWSKKWSDAPWEPWHNTYREGIWPPPSTTWPFLPLHVGSSGLFVWILNRRLKNCGYRPSDSASFGDLTSQAVRAFQAHHQLQVDAVVGPVTWANLKAAEQRCLQTHTKEV